MIRVFRETGADTLIGIYLGFFLLCALIFWIVEPGISTYWDALWYCFTVASTSSVFVLVMDWIRIGLPPPISRSPILTTLVLSLYAIKILS